MLLQESKHFFPLGASNRSRLKLPFDRCRSGGGYRDAEFLCRPRLGTADFSHSATPSLIMLIVIYFLFFLFLKLASEVLMPGTKKAVLILDLFV